MPKKPENPNNNDASTEAPVQNAKNADSSEIANGQNRVNSEINNIIPDSIPTSPVTPSELPTTPNPQTPHPRQPATPSPKTPPEPPTTPSPQTPPKSPEKKEEEHNILYRTFSKIRKSNGANLGQNINKNVEGFLNIPKGDEKLNGAPEDSKVLVKEILDGSVTNIARQVWSVTTPASSLLRSIYRTTTRPFFHPKDSFKNFKNYIFNPVRIVSSSLKLTKNILRAPLSLTNTAFNKLIKRPLEYLNAKIFKKIPLLDVIVPWLIIPPFQWTGNILNAIRGAYDGATDWSDKFDNWVSKKQNPHLKSEEKKDDKKEDPKKEDNEKPKPKKEDAKKPEPKKEDDKKDGKNKPKPKNKKADDDSDDDENE